MNKLRYFKICKALETKQIVKPTPVQSSILYSIFLLFVFCFLFFVFCFLFFVFCFLFFVFCFLFYLRSNKICCWENRCL